MFKICIYLEHCATPTLYPFTANKTAYDTDADIRPYSEEHINSGLYQNEEKTCTKLHKMALLSCFVIFAVVVVALLWDGKNVASLFRCLILTSLCVFRPC